MTKNNADMPKQLKVVVKGDRRDTENLILEVGQVARAFGLKVDCVQILPHSSVQPKTRKRRSRPNAGKTGSKSSV